MKKETLAHVGYLDKDSRFPGRIRHISFGKDISPEKAVMQAEILQITEPDLRGFLFVEAEDKPATVNTPCETCNRRARRMDYSVETSIKIMEYRDRVLQKR